MSLAIKSPLVSAESATQGSWLHVDVGAGTSPSEVESNVDGWMPMSPLLLDIREADDVPKVTLSPVPDHYVKMAPEETRDALSLATSSRGRGAREVFPSEGSGTSSTGSGGTELSESVIERMSQAMILDPAAQKFSPSEDVSASKLTLDQKLGSWTPQTRMKEGMRGDLHAWDVDSRSAPGTCNLRPQQTSRTDSTPHTCQTYGTEAVGYWKRASSKIVTGPNVCQL